MGLINNKIVDTPIKTNYKLNVSDEKLLSDVISYPQLIRNLFTLLTITRLDIFCVFHVVGQFIATPHSSHYIVIFCIFCYIKGTIFVDFLF